MTVSTKLEKAQLQELDVNFKNQIKPDKAMTVQFNPETLKVSFANQVKTPQGEQKSQQSHQFVGAGTTKLNVTLWFDVNAPQPEGSNVKDVRVLTQKVVYFITPQPAPDDPSKLLPPAVRFIWGSFQFDGMMDSLEESLEFFSHQGIPQRASVTLALSQQRIILANLSGAGLGNNAVGTRPMTQATSGTSLQSMAAASGKSNWQSIAEANGIENPRILPPGQLIDLNRPRR